MTDQRRVAVFPTCVVDVLAPQVGAAAVRVLRRAGFEVTVPRNATCCGQPAWNAGFADEAAKVARTTLKALSNEQLVCVPAGSCATMIRVFWPELFEATGDHASRAGAEALRPRVKELSELLTDSGYRPKGSWTRRAAYHHSCHMLRELGLRDQPRSLLESLEGCEIVHWPGDDRCCGFGGLFSMKQPEISVAMADDKLDGLKQSGAEVLVGCDQSCLMQLEGRMRRRGDRTPVRHLAEVLDEAST